MALTMDREIQTLSVQNVPNIRAVRRKYSRILQSESPKFILQLAKELFHAYDHWWVAYELIHNHPAALGCIGKSELLEFGKDINSWGTVDGFAGILAGPVWMNGQVSDALIHSWACSKDRWYVTMDNGKPLLQDDGLQCCQRQIVGGLADNFSYQFKGDISVRKLLIFFLR